MGKYPLNTAPPLVSNPEQLGPRQWPNVHSDHSLPLHMARIEALVCSLIATLLISALLFMLEAPLALWGGAAVLILSMALFIFLRRYEDHVDYVRADRSTTPELPDLDNDGQPDRIEGVWYGNGAPAAAADSLDGVYRYRFAEFCAACVHVDTDTRSLRRSGFDDGLQALFRNWLIAHNGGAWQDPDAHTLGWRLGSENDVRRVLRCTGWKELV